MLAKLQWYTSSSAKLTALWFCHFTCENSDAVWWTTYLALFKICLQGLLWWYSGKESACQAGDRGMPKNNWVRVPQLFSVCSRTQKPQILSHMPQLLKPAHPRTHAPQQEKLPQWEAHRLQPEEPHRLRLQKSPSGSEESAQPRETENILSVLKLLDLDYNLYKLIYKE